MKKRTKTRKPATIRLDELNAASCESMALDTGRSLSWCVNVLINAGRQYLKSGHPKAEELKLHLRTAALARQAAEQQRLHARKFQEAVKQIEQPDKPERKNAVHRA